MNEEQSDFKVSDRRKFDADGNLREESAEEETAQEAGETPLEEPVVEPEGLGHEPAGTESEATEEEGAAGEINFTTFILSLGTQAMVALGLIPDPTTSESSVSLTNAKQMIDILSMLRDKTQGNLEASDTTLLDNLLYDLQMHFVELSTKEE